MAVWSPLVLSLRGEVVILHFSLGETHVSLSIPIDYTHLTVLLGVIFSQLSSIGSESEEVEAHCQESNRLILQ